MTTNALGATFDHSRVGRVVVAHFEDRTLDELGSSFPLLRDLAAGWWESEVEPDTSLALHTLSAEDGTSFPGIDDSGVWLAGLFCVECLSPVPWSLTLLEPCQDGT